MVTERFGDFTAMITERFGDLTGIFHGTFREKLQELFVHRFGDIAGIIPVSVILLGSHGNVKEM